MPADSLAVPLATDVVGQMEKRLLRSLDFSAEEWSDSVTALTAWEDENLLDNPSPEQLRRHKATVEQLIRVGRVLSLATGHPDFPARATAELIAATQRMLEDKLAMWRGKMSENKRQEIVRTCFP
jgi:hypothetical protein